MSRARVALPERITRSDLQRFIHKYRQEDWINFNSQHFLFAISALANKNEESLTPSEFFILAKLLIDEEKKDQNFLNKNMKVIASILSKAFGKEALFLLKELAQFELLDEINFNLIYDKFLVLPEGEEYLNYLNTAVIRLWLNHDGHFITKDASALVEDFFKIYISINSISHARSLLAVIDKLKDNNISIDLNKDMQILVTFCEMDGITFELEQRLGHDINSRQNLITYLMKLHERANNIKSHFPTIFKTTLYQIHHYPKNYETMLSIAKIMKRFNIDITNEQFLETLPVADVFFEAIKSLVSSKNRSYLLCAFQYPTYAKVFSELVNLNHSTKYIGLIENDEFRDILFILNEMQELNAENIQRIIDYHPFIPNMVDFFSEIVTRQFRIVESIDNAMNKEAGLDFIACLFYIVNHFKLENQIQALDYLGSYTIHNEEEAKHFEEKEYSHTKIEHINYQDNSQSFWVRVLPTHQEEKSSVNQDSIELNNLPGRLNHSRTR